MKNLVIDTGTSFTIAAPSGGVTSGHIEVIDELICVAGQTVAEGEDFTAHVGCVHFFDKAPTQAITLGQKLYWDSTNNRVTTISTGNTLIGVSLQAQAASDTIAGKVLLRKFNDLDN